MNKIVRIKPNTRPDSIENFGLEQYGEVMMPGVKHVYTVAYIEQPGTNIIKYITGLDETHPSVLSLPDDERRQKIRQIRKEASEIYYLLSFIRVDVDDEHFWEKCSLLSPTNIDFWKNIKLEIDNLGRILNMLDVNSRILYNVIKAGGIPEVAPNQSIAMTDYQRYKFYLDDGTETSFVIKSRKSKTLAYSILGRYLESNEERITNRMGYLARILIPDNYIYSSNIEIISDSDKDLYFQLLDNYLSGALGVSSDFAVERFLEMHNKDQTILATAALIKELLNDKEAMILEDKSYFIKRGEIKLTDDLLESARLLSSHPHFADKFKDIVVYYSTKKKLVISDLLKDSNYSYDSHNYKQKNDEDSKKTDNNIISNNNGDDGSFTIETKDVVDDSFEDIDFISDDDSKIISSRYKNRLKKKQ